MPPNINLNRPAENPQNPPKHEQRSERRFARQKNYSPEKYVGSAPKIPRTIYAYTHLNTFFKTASLLVVLTLYTKHFVYSG